MLADIPIHVFRPVEHLQAHLQNSVRPDGRSLTQARPITIQSTRFRDHTNRVISSKQVQIGGSMAIAAITLSIGTPALPLPNKGDIECKVSLNHLYPDNMLNQRRSEEPNTSSGNGNCVLLGDSGLVASTQEVEYLLNTVFNNGKVIDLTQLCIEEGKFVFRLNVHVTVLSYAGNLRDLCFLGAMMALREVHLPQAVPTVATIKIAQKKGPDAVVDPNPFVINYETTRPLVVRQLALSVSLACSHLSVDKESGSHSSGTTVRCFVDPTEAEETVCDGVVTLVFAPAANTLLLSYTSSNAGLAAETLQEVLTVGSVHVQRMISELALE